jgi:protein gp37
VSSETAIQWVNRTRSPWIGCTKKSKGCAKCYMEHSTPTRVQGVRLGKGQPRYKVKTFEAAALADEREAIRTGKSISVFPSLCDWLDAEVPIEWLAEFLDVVRRTPHLTWILLTKRPENWHSRLGAIKTESEELAAWILTWWLAKEPPANVWFVVSCEDQDAWDERVPLALEIPAVVRGACLEPLLGPINMKLPLASGPQAQPLGRGIQWVIVGGESELPADDARVCEVMWIDEIVRDCRTFDCPVFVKQLGSHCVTANVNAHDWPEVTVFEAAGEGAASARVRLSHPKGGDSAEWPSELCIREFPKEVA